MCIGGWLDRLAYIGYLKFAILFKYHNYTAWAKIDWCVDHSMFCTFVTATDNLFADTDTKIERYNNFKLKIHSDCFGEAYQGFPSDYLFYILSRATQNHSYIIVALSDQYLVNEFKFSAYSDCWGEEGMIKQVKEPFSYKIEASNDLNSWQTVVDYSNCKCYFTQQLYFQRKSAK